MTKLCTYLVLKRIWNPIDFQGQRSRSLGQIFRRGDTPCFVLPLFYITCAFACFFFQKLYSLYKSVQAEIPETCILNKERDIYSIQEDQKFMEPSSKWYCNICGKGFITEYFLDLHFTNRHKEYLRQVYLHWVTEFTVWYIIFIHTLYMLCNLERTGVKLIIYFGYYFQTLWFSCSQRFKNYFAFKYLALSIPDEGYLRNKSWKPECVGSFNMDWRILVFYPKSEARDKIY